jgi:heme/copper-type cytochrome/quinol oxidase subunit 2
MVAMSLWGLIMAMTWIGALVLVLVGQAVWVWVRFRYAERAADHARRLVEATKAADRPAVTEARTATVLAFRSASNKPRSGAQSKAGP